MGLAMLETLLLLTGVIGPASAVIVLPGICATFPPDGNFEIDKLYGGWYTIEKFAMHSDQDYGPKCTYTEFVSDGTSGYDVLSTSYIGHIEQGTFHPITTRAHIEPLNDEVLADMKITIFKDEYPWTMSAHFVVLYASPSYAVVGGCNDLLNLQTIQYMQIISKTPTLSLSIVDRVKEVLIESYGIHAEYFVPETQMPSECQPSKHPLKWDNKLNNTSILP